MSLKWQDVGKAVASVAPVLAGVLGGPAGAVAAAGGSLLASFLGEEPEPEAVARALADPESLVRLKELETRERELLLQWRTEQLRAELANVQDARNREVELARAGHKAAWATTLVATIVVAGFFAMLHRVLTGGEAAATPAALLLLGSLGTGFGAVVNYYLGSSLGSQRKNELLAQGWGAFPTTPTAKENK